MIPVCEMANLGTGMEWKQYIPRVQEWEGKEKKNPRIGEREGNEKSIPRIQERESEASIPGNGREQEFQLTPDLQLHMTTCQISCTELVQRVSKILTPHRLLRNWFAMAQFNAGITRFPYMYDEEGSI